MYDLQKASMWKRISAALLDVILLVIVATGVAFLLSTVLQYDAQTDRLNDLYSGYEQTYGVKLDITSAEYEAMSEADRALYEDAIAALTKDAEVNRVYGLIFNYTLIIISFSILVSYLLLELLVPLILKNGQTVGKKVFGIGVMRQDGVRVPPVLMFARTVLGKCTVETMVPVLIIVMIYFGLTGIIGLAAIGILLVIQLFLLIATRGHTPIHDMLAHTVTVDLSSQMIFDTPEELLAYKQRIHAEEVEASRN